MYNIDVNTFFTQRSKYDMRRFMRYDTDAEMYDILDSEFINELKSLPLYGTKLITVEEGSPSLLCETIYGYFNYSTWWILMEVNGLTSPDDLVTGLTIRYPYLANLDTLLAALNPKNNG